MNNKKDNDIFVNLILFIIIVATVYYIFIMPEDFPVHSKMLIDAVNGVIK